LRGSFEKTQVGGRWFTALHEARCFDGDVEPHPKREILVWSTLRQGWTAARGGEIVET